MTQEKNHGVKRINKHVETDEKRENAGLPETSFIFDARHAKDDLAEELGEEFVLSATSGDDVGEIRDRYNEEEERGGPFIQTRASTEFAYDVDEANPVDAEKQAFPTV